MMYATTDDFLVHFGLRDLSELPSIDELQTFLGAVQDESE